jgi:hypothetical protein
MKYTHEDFVPVGGHVLVQPLKPHKLNTVKSTRTDEALKKAADLAAKGEEYIFTKDDMIEEKVRVDSTFRVGKVLAARENSEFTEGQYIVYQEGSKLPFDLLSTKVNDDKCPVLIKEYDIKFEIKETSIDKVK